MTRKRDEIDDRRVDDSLARLRDALEPPSEDELRAMARSASRQQQAAPAPRRGSRVDPRWIGASIAAALIVGSGLGFGLGSSVAPGATAERVTIVAPPVVEAGQPLVVSGSVENGKSGDTVDVEAKDCGQRFFRGVAGATTEPDGRWSTQLSPWITTTLRAVWRTSVSSPITVRARVWVSLSERRAGGFEVWVVGKAQFWHKQVVVQRRRQGTWRAAKSVLLTETGSQDPTGRSGANWSKAEFDLSVPRGTLVRAVFPLSQARPCYLPGVSKPLRT